jgi:hypothetical protein
MSPSIVLDAHAHGHHSESLKKDAHVTDKVASVRGCFSAQRGLLLTRSILFYSPRRNSWSLIPSDVSRPIFASNTRVVTLVPSWAPPLLVSPYGVMRCVTTRPIRIGSIEIVSTLVSVILYHKLIFRFNRICSFCWPRLSLAVLVSPLFRIRSMDHGTDSAIPCPYYERFNGLQAAGSHLQQGWPQRR